LHAIQPFKLLSPGRSEAALASPTAESLADIFRAEDEAQADTFLAQWDSLFVGKPNLRATVDLLLEDAADQVAFSECHIFNEYSLDDSQLARISTAFDDAPAFAAELKEVSHFVQTVVSRGAKARPSSSAIVADAHLTNVTVLPV